MKRLIIMGLSLLLTACTLNQSQTSEAYLFEYLMLRADRLWVREEGTHAYIQGLHREIIDYDGSESTIVYGQDASAFSVVDQTLSVLPFWGKEARYVMDLNTHEIEEKEYLLPDNSHHYQPASYLYAITPDQYWIANYCADEEWTQCGYGYLKDGQFEVLGDDRLLGYASRDEIEIKLVGLNITGYLLVNDVEIDDMVDEFQWVKDTIYYTRNIYPYSGYGREVYLMSYNTQTKEKKQLVEEPVISFQANEKGVYYSLDPTVFTEDPDEYTGNDLNEIRTVESHGLYFMNHDEQSELIADGIYSNLALTQYGLAAMYSDLETENIQLVLFQDGEMIVLQEDTMENCNITMRWTYNLDR